VSSAVSVEGFDQETPHAQHMEHMQHSQPQHPKKAASIQTEASRSSSLPVETPDVPKTPWKMVNGVKQFHLIAEPVRREFVPGKVVDVWGYNGSLPGPTIEANEGDRVRVIFDKPSSGNDRSALARL